MNFPKAYGQRRGGFTEEDLNAVRQDAFDAKQQSAHLEWYKLQQTQEFITFLQQEEKKQLELAVSLACSGAGEKQKDKALIRAKQLKDIIDYARTGRTRDNRDKSDE